MGFSLDERERVDSTRLGRISAVLPAEDKQALLRLAASRNRTLSDVLREMIRYCLKELKEDERPD